MRYRIFLHIKSTFIFLFWLIIALIVLFCIYFFYRPETQIFNIKFTNPIYAYVEKMLYWVYLVIYITIFSVFSFALFLTLSLYYNFQRNRSSILFSKYTKFYTYVLTNYLLLDIYENDEFRDNLFKKIKPFLKKRRQIEALLCVYTKIQETLAMDLSEKFKFLLSKLNLYKKMEFFLVSNSFEDRILAMKTVSYLRLNDYEQLIKKYSNNRNFALRTESYAALIRLMKNDENLVKFIGEKHQLSLLDMNIIVNAVLKNFKLNIDYKALLSSNNQRKIMIGLMLAKYRYPKNKRNLILILNHIGNSNELHSELAWDALLTIVPDDDALDIIIDRFDNEPDDIKRLILKKSYSIDNERFSELLVKIINTETLLIKIEAMKILFKNNFYLLYNFTNSEDRDIQMAYKETFSIYMNIL